MKSFSIKRYALALVACLLVLALAGCGGGAKTFTEDQPEYNVQKFLDGYKSFAASWDAAQADKLGECWDPAVRKEAVKGWKLLAAKEAKAGTKLTVKSYEIKPADIKNRKATVEAKLTVERDGKTVTETQHFTLKKIDKKWFIREAKK